VGAQEAKSDCGARWLQPAAAARRAGRAQKLLNNTGKGRGPEPGVSEYRWPAQLGQLPSSMRLGAGSARELQVRRGHHKIGVRVLARAALRPRAQAVAQPAADAADKLVRALHRITQSQCLQA